MTNTQDDDMMVVQKHVIQDAAGEQSEGTKWTYGEAVVFHRPAREVPILLDGVQRFACASEGSAISATNSLNALEAKARWAENIAKPALEDVRDVYTGILAVKRAREALTAYPQPVQERGGALVMQPAEASGTHLDPTPDS